MNRRRFLTGLGFLLAAPAVIRTPGLLMPVTPFDDGGMLDATETFTDFETDQVIVRAYERYSFGYTNKRLFPELDSVLQMQSILTRQQIAQFPEIVDIVKNDMSLQMGLCRAKLFAERGKPTLTRHYWTTDEAKKAA